MSASGSAAASGTASGVTSGATRGRRPSIRSRSLPKTPLPQSSSTLVPGNAFSTKLGASIHLEQRIAAITVYGATIIVTFTNPV